MQENALKSLRKQQFDSEIFKVDYFRIVDFDKENILKDLKLLKKSSIIDVKINSCDMDLDLFLKDNGFRKICTQVLLDIDDIKDISPSSAKICDTLQIPKDLILQHSKNFTSNRFLLDNCLDSELSFRLYEKWIENSLADKDIKIAHIDNDFCTFKIKDKIIHLDLLSVLNKNKGIATKLLQAIRHYAFVNKINKIITITECGNQIAFNLYKKNQFIAKSFFSCFNLIIKE